MRRIGFAVLFALGFLFAGAMSAAVVAETTPTTGTTSTGTTATTTTATTTTTTTTTPSVQLLPAGVKISGVAVGGLTPDAAVELLEESFAAPLQLRVAGRRLTPSATDLGAVAYVRGAVERARLARPGSRLQLVVSVKGQAVRGYVAKLAKRFDRKPVDARLTLHNVQPRLTKDAPGRRVDKGGAVREIVAALRTNDRGPLTVPLKAIAPTVTQKAFSTVIVIRRGSNRLYLYKGAKSWRTFGVATGQSIYPTPLGRFAIAVMWKNPTWTPPNSAWAQGLHPVPPGPAIRSARAGWV